MTDRPERRRIVVVDEAMQRRLIVALLWPTTLTFGVTALVLVVLGVLGVVDAVLLFRMRQGLHGRRATPEKLSNGDENPIFLHLENRYAFPVEAVVVDEVPVQFQVRDAAFHAWIPVRGRKTQRYTLRPVRRAERDAMIARGAVTIVPDLVDVDFDIQYRMPGQFSGGIGYSESQKLILNGSIVHTNFLGTGNRVALNLNSGRFSKLYSLSHTDPYATGPAEGNQWIQSGGPHIMVVFSDAAMLEGISADPEAAIAASASSSVTCANWPESARSMPCHACSAWRPAAARNCST